MAGAVAATGLVLALQPQALAQQVGRSGVGGSTTRFVQPVERQVTLRPLRDRSTRRPLRDRSTRLSEKGVDLWKISAISSFDIPAAALAAYHNAASRVAQSNPGCQLPWTLLAGIGRVESDHGRYGGSVLGSDGVPRPAIIGIPLDGHGPVAAVRDSDNGRFDGDRVWDRAVGPMQFIPTTWASAGRDGDGDGIATPNDIDDAALATADYLCPSGGSILAPGAMQAAVYGYNHSDYYVALVLAFEEGYRTGIFSIPSPPPPPRVGGAGHRRAGATSGPNRRRRSGAGTTHSGAATPGKPQTPHQPHKPAAHKPPKSPKPPTGSNPPPKPPKPPAPPTPPPPPPTPTPTDPPPTPTPPTPTPTPPTPTPTPPRNVDNTGS